MSKLKMALKLCEIKLLETKPASHKPDSVPPTGG